jgi:hypothetical protein
MIPSKIFDILDLARRARNLGEVFNPLFVGPPGVGKSQIVQAWCVKNNLPFIDLRSAYLEAPDVIGFPSIENVNGKQMTVHNTPDFWPTDSNWEGVLLLEEPNRGTASIMNCWMQLLTDRKVHKYSLPKGVMVIGCINPEGTEYEVNNMDAALKDRFEIFQVSYDKESFLSFMKSTGWHKDIILFIESGMFNYLQPEEIKNSPGSKYVSPRTLSKINSILKAGFNQEDEMLLYTTILGGNIGKDFYNFRHNESPVFYFDLMHNLPGSLEKLNKFSDPNNFKNGMISITIKDIVDNGEISDDLLVSVIKTIPVDQGTMLIRDLEFKRKDKEILSRLCKNHPSIKDLFKSVLNYKKTK